MTQTVAICAQRRKGKTYTASVIAEGLIEANQPIVVLDPTGAWWGLRSIYPVVIIGGKHGDVPLETGGGKVVADQVVNHPGFYIIDLSRVHDEDERDRFCADFGERLFAAKEERRFPLHLFLDEADIFVPQSIERKIQMRTRRAYDTIVRRGGILGLGTTLITQRPAVVSKNVLTQADTLIALSTSGELDVAAIKNWIGHHGLSSRFSAKELSSLPVGRGFVFSPSWLSCLELVNIRERRSFNSSATPKVGEMIGTPELAKVDLVALTVQMRATMEKVKQEDPALLREEIAKLKTEIVQLKRMQPLTPPIPPTIEVVTEVIPEMLRHHIEAIQTEIFQVEEHIIATTKTQLAILARRRVELVKACKIVPRERAKLPPPPVVAPPPPPSHIVRVESQGELKGVKGRVLAILLSRQAAGLATDQSQLALIAGLSANSSHIGNVVSSLRSAGCIEGTSESLRVVGPYQNGPKVEIDGAAIQAAWLEKLGGVHASALTVILEAYPGTLTRDEVATRLGLSLTSSHIGNVISAVRTQGLITGDAKALKARDEFFL